MSEISRRAVLGGMVGGALAGALPAGGALAGTGAEPDVSDVDGADFGGHRLHDAMASARAWARFLAGADLIWQRMPTTWFEGPFLGNGLLGSGIYAEPGANAVRFNVQHSQVQDHRPEFGSLF